MDHPRLAAPCPDPQPRPRSGLASARPTSRSTTAPRRAIPREAAHSDWQNLASFDKIEHQFPRALGIDWLDLGREVTTRAIRLRITSRRGNALGNLTGKTHEGKRIWLGELMALQDLGTADLKSAILPPEKTAAAPPPIAIHFTLEGARLRHARH